MKTALLVLGTLSSIVLNAQQPSIEDKQLESQTMKGYIAPNASETVLHPFTSGVGHRDVDLSIINRRGQNGAIRGHDPRIGWTAPLGYSAEEYDFKQLRGGSGVDSCGVDTLEYLIGKNTLLEWYYLADTTFNNGGNVHDWSSGYAQYYDAPQAVDVHGACFYGYLFTAGDSALVTVSLYSAASDSFPDQLITQKDIWVYDDFSAVNLNVMRQCVEFDSIITMNSAYLIALETNTTEELLVLSNSFANLDGAGEELGFTYYSDPMWPAFHAWYDQYHFAANWDFDWIIEPSVSYHMAMNLVADADTICEGDQVCLDLTVDTIFYHRMYNSSATPHLLSVDYDWDDGTTESDTILPKCHIYGPVGMNDVAISASVNVNTWKGLNCVAQSQVALYVNPLPVAGFSHTDNLGGNISFVNTSSNADSIWYDLGDGSTSTDTNFVYQYSQTGTTYTVTMIAYNDCGTDTTIVNILPDPLGVSTINLEDIISVYPNPTNGKVFVNASGNDSYKLEVYNVVGELIETRPFTHTSAVDLTSKADGLYFVKVSSGTQSLTKKVLLAR